MRPINDLWDSLSYQTQLVTLLLGCSITAVILTCVILSWAGVY